MAPPVAMCKSTARLDGKTALITGTNTGIGKMTAQEFYKRGARVIMACRSVDKAEAAADEIKKNCLGALKLGELVIVHLDLTSLVSVRKCAEYILRTEKRLDVLVNNAGIMCSAVGKTADGFETQFGVNHVGPFALTLLLLPRMIKTGNARVVTVSSSAHLKGKIQMDDLNREVRPYCPGRAYDESKLCNVLFARELARRLQEAGVKGVTAYSLHPGAIYTELGRYLDESHFRGLYFIWRMIGTWFFKTPLQGAQTTLHCAVDEKAGKETGLYYSDCEVVEPSEEAMKDDDARELWDISAKMCSLGRYNPFVAK